MLMASVNAAYMWHHFQNRL